MSAYVAFLRAINVGGRAIVKMDALGKAFRAAGCHGVRTLIQSGNVVFEAPATSAPAVFRGVRAKLRSLLGSEPGVFFRTTREIEAMVRRAPLKRFQRPGVKLYVAFLAQHPRRRPPFPLRSPSERLDAVAMRDREVFIVSRRKKSGFFGFPNNFIERELGVAATTRNWSTITKIAELTKRGPGAAASD